MRRPPGPSLPRCFLLILPLSLSLIDESLLALLHSSGLTQSRRKTSPGNTLSLTPRWFRAPAHVKIGGKTSFEESESGLKFLSFPPGGGLKTSFHFSGREGPPFLFAASKAAAPPRPQEEANWLLFSPAAANAAELERIQSFLGRLAPSFKQGFRSENAKLG